MKEDIVDICMVCEGSYPYLKGGVADWTHELINANPDLTFHIITLMPLRQRLKLLYELPKNVKGTTVYRIQNLPRGSSPIRAPKKTFEVLKSSLKGLISSKTFDDFGPILDLFAKYNNRFGKKILTESEKIWQLFLEIYNETIPKGPFKSYFGTIYALSQSFYSIVLPKIPKAKIYHAVCTGYAGFFLYRAKKEFGSKGILTEHGIYSNERRIEIAMSEWIVEKGALDLALEDKKKTLKDFWLNAFYSFAHVCYKSSDEILTTFDGNQEIQLEGGADPKKIRTIVYGIDIKKYGHVPVEEHAPMVAFVGRVVPIKDVKTYIRACKKVSEELPDVQLNIIGPTEEDKDYYEECKKVIDDLGLRDKVKFLGHVDLKKEFPKIDVLVLTSISEAQPLVMLEAGFFGVPCVATNVGACKQLLYGSVNESPSLGQGGIVTPLANPEATAEAIIKLMTDKDFYKSCSRVFAERIRKYYRIEEHHAEYKKIYNKHLEAFNQGDN